MLLTLELYKQGLNPEEIAQKRNLQLSTIMGHLVQLIEMNQPVDLNRLVSSADRQVILQALQTLGTDSLKSIYEYLQQKYSYGEIRLVKAWNERSQKSEGEESE
ncbi:MAG: hypothetical protein NVS2B14_05990 [Chamaesiphon sp.]